MIAKYDNICCGHGCGYKLAFEPEIAREAKVETEGLRSAAAASDDRARLHAMRVP